MAAGMAGQRKHTRIGTVNRYHITAVDPADGMVVRILYRAATEQEARDHIRYFYWQYVITSCWEG